MFALYFVGSVLLSMLVTVGGTFLLVPWLPDDSPTVIFAVTLATAFLALGAMSAGGYLQWLPGDRAKRRRYLRTLILASGAVQLVGAAGFVACAIVVGAPAWIPLAVIAAGAVFTVFSHVTGRALGRRTEPMTDAEVDDAGIDGSRFRRTLRTMAIVAGSFAAVVSAAFIAIVGALEGVDVGTIATGLLAGAALGCFAASLVAFRASFKILGALRAVTGGDYAQARIIAQVVVRRKQHQLDPEEQRRAVRYARLLRRYLPLQALQAGFLFVGIGAMQVVNAFSADGFTRMLSVWLIVFLLVGVVVLVPLTVRQHRRIRGYLEEHAGALPAS